MTRRLIDRWEHMPDRTTRAQAVVFGGGPVWLFIAALTVGSLICAALGVDPGQP